MTPRGRPLSARETSGDDSSTPCSKRLGTLMTTHIPANSGHQPTGHPGSSEVRTAQLLAMPNRVIDADNSQLVATDASFDTPRALASATVVSQPFQPRPTMPRNPLARPVAERGLTKVLQQSISSLPKRVQNFRPIYKGGVPKRRPWPHPPNHELGALSSPSELRSSGSVTCALPPSSTTQNPNRRRPRRIQLGNDNRLTNFPPSSQRSRRGSDRNKACLHSPPTATLECFSITGLGYEHYGLHASFARSLVPEDMTWVLTKFPLFFGCHHNAFCTPQGSQL